MSADLAKAALAIEGALRRQSRFVNCDAPRDTWLNEEAAAEWRRLHEGLADGFRDKGLAVVETGLLHDIEAVLDMARPLCLQAEAANNAREPQVPAPVYDLILALRPRVRAALGVVG